MAEPVDIFVGRDSELATLRRALEDSRSGRGRLAMLAGEPGIGKTRTAQELAQHASGRGVVVLWGRCHEEAGAPSYWPWVQIIRAALAACDCGASLRGLGDGAADVADIVPEIRDRVPELARPTRLGDPAAARFRMFESIRQFLTGLCRRQPLLVVLENLHWADAPSLRLLEFLAPEIGDSRILMAGTYRANELSRQHPLSDALGGLARMPHLLRVHLPGLSAAEVGAYISAVAGTPPPLALAKALHEQTEGNPLFLREVVRFLDQQRLLGTVHPLPSAVRIPEGVREVIGRRLNLLSAPCNDVLAAASVIGREFAADVLLRVVAPADENAMLEALDEALAAHIIDEIGAGQYQFTHNLVRMTLYDELRPTRRKRLHHAVGVAIEAVHGADPDAVFAELAHHFHTAGELDRTIEYAMKAGERAEALLAFEGAVQSFQLALDAADERARADDILRCRLLLMLGEAQRKSGDFPVALATSREAAETAKGLRHGEFLARAALIYERTAWRVERPANAPPESLLTEALRLAPEGSVALRVELMGALARSLLHAGAVAEARGYLDRAIPMARRLADPALLATTLNYLFDFPWRPDRTRQRLAEVNEALAAAEETGDAEMAVNARWRRVNLHLELGEVAIADSQLRAMRRLETRLCQPLDSFMIRSQEAMLALLRGQLDAAERLIAEALRCLPRGDSALPAALSLQIFALRREQGRLRELGPLVSQFMRSAPAAATWRPGVALLYLELGRLDEARAEFAAMVTPDLEGLPRDGRWSTCLVFLTEVCAALGDRDRAATLYDEFLPYAGCILVLGGGLMACGWSGRHLGLLCATMHRWPEAARHFEEALAANERIGARLPLAHTQHDYAAMLLARGEPGDRERAIALLRASLDSAKELGLRALEERVAARLCGLFDTPPLAAAANDELTARESEVLGLLAIGRSNADIGMALSISLNTVATHVRSILAKTGCANRTEAAAYAMRRGLAAGSREA